MRFNNLLSLTVFGNDHIKFFKFTIHFMLQSNWASYQIYLNFFLDYKETEIALRKRIYNFECWNLFNKLVSSNFLWNNHDLMKIAFFIKKRNIYLRFKRKWAKIDDLNMRIIEFMKNYGIKIKRFVCNFFDFR